MRNNKYLYIITLTYFVLGFLNIHFALLGIVCMAIPLILLFKDKKKTWCQGYCPRANLYRKCGKLTSKFSLKTPMFFIKGNMKWIMLAYFGVSLIIIILSTIKVAQGANPMSFVKFLLFFKVGEMPQIVQFSSVLPWLSHLSYRFYSLMFTTTTLGLIFALVYKPRTWCTVCPIATVSDMYIKGCAKSDNNIKMGVN